jgi:hypothetical protein
MTIQPSQQPDGVEPSAAADVPLFDPGNRLLMVRPVELVTGIFTHESGQRFGLATMRDQGNTFTVYLPAEGLASWIKVYEQLYRDLTAPTGRGLIVPGLQRANGHVSPGL